MRIRDLMEGTMARMAPGMDSTLSRTLSVHDMNDYEFYRFCVAVAGFPGESIPTEGIFHDNPVAIAYTPQETEMINAALKKMGKTHLAITASGSREPDFVHKVSPVVSARDPFDGYITKKSQLKI